MTGMDQLATAKTDEIQARNELGSLTLYDIFGDRLPLHYRDGKPVLSFNGVEYFDPRERM